MCFGLVGGAGRQHKQNTWLVVACKTKNFRKKGDPHVFRALAQSVVPAGSISGSLLMKLP